MLLQSLTFDHFLIRKVKKNLTLVTQAASKTKLLIEKRERKYFIVSLTTFSCVIQHSIVKQMLWSKNYQLFLFPDGTVWEHKPLLLLTKSLRWTPGISASFIVMSCCHENNCFECVARAQCNTLEWFSKRAGTSFQNSACSKNAEKKLGRERRRVLLKSDLAVVSTNRPRYICSWIS